MARVWVLSVGYDLEENTWTAGVYSTAERAEDARRALAHRSSNLVLTIEEHEVDAEPSV